jgi:chromosomal replication initiator protein
MLDVEIDTLWGKVLDKLEREVRTPAFGTWVKGVSPESLTGNVLTLQVPNEFAKHWLQSRYGALIRASIEELTGVAVEIRMVAHQDRSVDALSGNDEWVAPASTEAAPAATATDEYRSRLNDKYLFSTFVVGNSNRFAQAACLAVAEMPSRAYNPLFVYGGVGLGKTHLMHAIGHRVLEDRPTARVLYVSSETFTNEMINAIRSDRMVLFRQRYRNIDVLLIDDIQFVAGKEGTQEEFFHTFEALHGAGKQIVISSDSPPKDIPTLEERLRSRFEWGLITDIQPPDLETRIAILAKKAQMEQLDVPGDILELIATRIDTNIRELEGALIRVIAYASVIRAPLTLELAHEALKDVVVANRPRPITIRAIQEEVARHYDLKPDDFQSKRRTRAVAFPRQVAMYLARELTDASLPRIGEAFGGRDHTTVMHAYDKIQQERRRDPALNHLLEDMARRLKSR